MELLKAQGLVKNYHETGRVVEVLRGVDLSIDSGEILGIVGPSGVGKTTLLYLLGALERPTDGRVLFEGEEVFNTKDDVKLAEFRNTKIGFVFQFHHLIPEFTAAENVMMPPLLARETKEAARAKAIEAMTMLGVGHRTDHKPGELSGGEQQRVAVARALVMKPSLVLADEPTGNLDTDTGERLHEEFLRLNKEHDITFVIVTHNENLAQKLPKLIRLERGKSIWIKK